MISGRSTLRSDPSRPWLGRSTRFGLMPSAASARARLSGTCGKGVLDRRRKSGMIFRTNPIGT